jgi:ATP-dependent DNA helicase DinG
MCYEQIKQAVQTAYDQTKQQAGFKERWAQKQMIGLLAREFGHSSESYAPICIVEAGTGTGKTYGYCLPLIPIAKAAEKKLVIATATVALQEQLFNNDLPALKAASGLDFTYALAKGRRRYVCPLRIVNNASINQLAMFDNGDTVEYAKRLAEELDSGWSGDFDTLDYQVPDSVKSTFSTDSAGCIKSRCPHYDKCPFVLAKKRLFAADVIVANHALLISDLNIIDKGGVALPVAEECFHVIDEAHHLPHSVLNNTASSHLLHGASTWVETIIKLGEGLHTKGNDVFKEHISISGVDEDVVHLASKLKERLTSLYSTFSTSEQFKPTEHERMQASRFKREGEPHVTRFIGGLVPDWLNEVGIAILSDSRRLFELLEGVINAAQESLDKSLDDDMVALVTEIGFLRDRLDNMANTWSLMTEQKEAHPHAKWVEYREKGNNIDFLVSASQTEAATFLNRTLFNQTCGIVMTSATISAMNSFDYYLRDIGISEEDSKLLRLASPFDYQTRTSLTIPMDFADPSDAQTHTQAIIAWAKEGHIKSDEGTLMLFTSSKQMNTVADALRDNFIILKQGEQPKTALIDAHKANINAGRGSILMGLDSFGEGLNLPGRYCTHVVVAKLPFPVPSSPVEKSQAEYVESIGGNSFMQISVPAASKKLTQWVGRLMRTEEDWGRVSILDPRLKTKRYGKTMVAGLPPFGQ